MSVYTWGALIVVICLDLVQVSHSRELGPRPRRRDDHRTASEACKGADLVSPPGCGEEGNGEECELAVSWASDENRVRFSLSAVVDGPGAVWSALGLSEDGMQSDLTLCWMKENGTSSLLRAKSIKLDSRENVTLQAADKSVHSVLLLEEAKLEGTQLVCRFSLPKHLDGLDLRDPLHVLIASGGTDNGELPINITRVVYSEGELALTCSASCEGETCDWVKMLLIKLHGVAMIVAFVLLLPSGAVVARYYQLVLADSWFMAHRGLVLAGVACVILGFSLVLSHTGGAFHVGLHQMVGITCICLSVLQPIYGFLRPHVGSTVQRRVFNIVHRTLGVSVISLGVFALFLGSGLFHNQVHGWIVAVLAFSLVISLSLVVMMECYNRTHRTHTPPVGYQKVTKDDLSDSEEEVYVKEEGGTGDGRQATKKEMEEGGGQPHQKEKGILLVFVLQSFTCAGVVSALLFYYD